MSMPDTASGANQPEDSRQGRLKDEDPGAESGHMTAIRHGAGSGQVVDVSNGSHASDVSKSGKETGRCWRVAVSWASRGNGRRSNRCRGQSGGEVGA